MTSKYIWIASDFPHLDREARSPSSTPARLHYLAHHSSEHVQRIARRNPALPSATWRKLILSGCLEAWDNPQALVGLFGWVALPDDEVSLAEGARKASIELLQRPDAAGPEGRARIAQHLAVWWREETSATELLDYLGHSADIAGKASPQHRRCTHLCVLVARTMTHLIPNEGDRAEVESVLGKLKAWTVAPHSSIDLGALRDRAKRVFARYENKLRHALGPHLFDQARVDHIGIGGFQPAPFVAYPDETAAAAATRVVHLTAHLAAHFATANRYPKTVARIAGLYTERLADLIHAALPEVGL